MEQQVYNHFILLRHIKYHFSLASYQLLEEFMSNIFYFLSFFSLLLKFVFTSLPFKEYTLVITKEIVPNKSKFQLRVNGTSPGPTIYVNLGQTLKINVINQIFNDSTAIHWHGMKQFKTQWDDGVINVTQCPIPNIPGKNVYQYVFKPSSAGTYWYHGHYHGQHPDGIYLWLYFSFFTL